MTTQNLYQKTLNEEMSPSQFLWHVRRDPQYSSIITNTMSFEDTISCLKSKGFIWETANQGSNIKPMDFLGSFKRLTEAATKKQKLKGGKGDKLTPDQVNYFEFTKGWKHELEHTDDIDKAKEIALDHLSEDPMYYTRLQMVEFEKKKKERSDLPIDISKKKASVKDEKNQMTPVKKAKNEKSNVSDSGKQEKARSKNAGVKKMKGGSGEMKSLRESLNEADEIPNVPKSLKSSDKRKGRFRIVPANKEVDGKPEYPFEELLSFNDYVKLAKYNSETNDIEKIVPLDSIANKILLDIKEKIKNIAPGAPKEPKGPKMQTKQVDPFPKSEPAPEKIDSPKSGSDDDWKLDLGLSKDVGRPSAQIKKPPKTKTLRRFSQDTDKKPPFAGKGKYRMYYPNGMERETFIDTEEEYDKYKNTPNILRISYKGSGVSTQKEEEINNKVEISYEGGRKKEVKRMTDTQIKSLIRDRNAEIKKGKTYPFDIRSKDAYGKSPNIKGTITIIKTAEEIKKLETPKKLSPEKRASILLKSTVKKYSNPKDKEEEIIKDAPPAPATDFPTKSATDFPYLIVNVKDKAIVKGVENGEDAKREANALNKNSNSTDYEVVSKKVAKIRGFLKEEKQGNKSIQGSQIVFSIEDAENKSATQQIRNNVVGVSFDEGTKKLVLRMSGGGELVYTPDASGKPVGVYFPEGQKNKEVSNTVVSGDVKEPLKRILDKKYITPKNVEKNSATDKMLEDYIRQRIRKALKEGDEGPFIGSSGPEVVKKKLTDYLQRYSPDWNTDPSPKQRAIGAEYQGIIAKLVAELNDREPGLGTSIYKEYTGKVLRSDQADQATPPPQTLAYDPAKLVSRGGRIAEASPILRNQLEKDPNFKKMVQQAAELKKQGKKNNEIHTLLLGNKDALKNYKEADHNYVVSAAINPEMPASPFRKFQDPS